MDRHKTTRQKGQDDTMHDIEPEQGRLSHLVRPQHEEANFISNEGSGASNGCPDGNPPVGQLVPREEIAGVTQSQGQDEENDPNHPVKLPGRAVRSGVEYPDHMEKDRYDHGMGCPSVEIPQNLAIVNACG